MQRRYGPVQDAGVGVIEKEGSKPIQESMLGCAAYTGILERGEVSKVIITTSKKDLIKKTGGFIPDSLLPDAAQDFHDFANGAGILFLYRVTDGTERKARLYLYDRKIPRTKVVTIEAKNGGAWGGKRQTVVVDMTTPAVDLAETTVTLPTGFVCGKNEYKGGTLYLTGASKTYKIVSNTAGVAPATRAVITVTSDSTMDTDYGVSTDPELGIVMASQNEWGEDRFLAALVKDGAINPSTEFGLEIYCNGELVLNYEDLSMDPLSSKYFVDLINNDGNNEWVTVTNHWTGAATADCRPANAFGQVATADVATSTLSLNKNNAMIAVDASGAHTNTIGTFTIGANCVEDSLTISYVVGPPAHWTVVSTGAEANHTFPDATGGVAYVADNRWSFGFTVTEAGPIAGDHFHVKIIPLPINECQGGRIHLMDTSNVKLTAAPSAGFFITSNTPYTVSISVGDLTLGATIPADLRYRLEWQQQFEYGYEGIYDVASANFTNAYDVSASVFNDFLGKDYGLIKHATPGIHAAAALFSGLNATTIQKAGIAYANAKNWQFRTEFNSTVVDEYAAKTYIQTTIGKDTYQKCCFPSYVYISDPILKGRLKLTTNIGMIHGWEAKVAKAYLGYHKIAAGEDVKLAKIVKFVSGIGTRELNGEILNPAGIQRIRIKNGNFILWGGRIPSTDPEYIFCNHREQMSHYEHTLLSAFDWIVFAMNDDLNRPLAIASLDNFFREEWRPKRALKGDTFADACTIKADNENNTPASEAAGEMNADVTLRLQDTVEKFIITIGKKGIFERTSP